MKYKLRLFNDVLVYDETPIMKNKQIKRYKRKYEVYYNGDKSKRMVLTDSGLIDLYLVLSKSFKVSLTDSLNRIKDRMEYTALKDIADRDLQIADVILSRLENERCIKNLSNDFKKYWSTYMVNLMFTYDNLINMRYLGYPYGQYLFNNAEILGEGFHFNSIPNKQEVQSILSAWYEVSKELLIDKGLMTQELLADFMSGSKFMQERVQMNYEVRKSALSRVVFNVPISNTDKYSRCNQDDDMSIIDFNSIITLKLNDDLVPFMLFVCIDNGLSITFAVIDSAEFIRAGYSIQLDLNNSLKINYSNDQWKGIAVDKLEINPDRILKIVYDTYKLFHSRRASKKVGTITNSNVREKDKGITLLTDNFNSEITIREYKESHKEFVKSISKHSHHKSPKPHYRSGYTRISKYGVVSKVAPTIVNKDKLDGIINYNIERK